MLEVIRHPSVHRIFFTRHCLLAPSLKTDISACIKNDFDLLYGKNRWQFELKYDTFTVKTDQIWNISAGITMPLDINQAYNPEGEIKIYEMEGSHFCLISLYLTNTHAHFLADNQMCSSRILTTEINCNVSSTKETFKKKREFSLQSFFAMRSRFQSILTFLKGQKLKKVQCIIIYAFQEALLFFGLSSLH